MADVERMFLQIKVDERDQDALRYLWRDLKSDDPPRVYRLQRLAFGVNCSPFLAIATAQSHAKKCKEQFLMHQKKFCLICTWTIVLLALTTLELR